MTSVVGRVVGLWRYPVKSLDGEQLPAVRLDRRGVELDRMWALVNGDGGIASGKTTRRFRAVRGLLLHRSRMDGDLPVITLADGRSASVGSAEMDDLVREMAGEGWSLRREDSVPHFDDGAVHVVTTATLATLSAAARTRVEAERFRPNVLLETDPSGFPEDAWIGRSLRLGKVELRVVSRVVRCVMVDQARPTLPARNDVLKTTAKVNDMCVGVYADVIVPGTVRMGDVALLADQHPAAP